MKSPTSVCPVPPEQRPINEYQDLKESWYFRWATLELRGYLTPIVWIWMLSWIVVGPVSAVSFPPGKQLGHFLLSGTIGASLLPLLALLRLYLGWTYVQNRLLSQTVFYEESGWYDGQTWTKPPEVLTQDQLIVTYQIKPILQRMRRTFGIVAVLAIVTGLLWQVV